jgi:hypothetical protein
VVSSEVQLWEPANKACTPRSYPFSITSSRYASTVNHRIVRVNFPRPERGGEGGRRIDKKFKIQNSQNSLIRRRAIVDSESSTRSRAEWGLLQNFFSFILGRVRLLRMPCLIIVAQHPVIIIVIPAPARRAPSEPSTCRERDPCPRNSYADEPRTTRAPRDRRARSRLVTDVKVPQQHW